MACMVSRRILSVHRIVAGIGWFMEVLVRCSLAAGIHDINRDRSVFPWGKHLELWKRAHTHSNPGFKPPPDAHNANSCQLFCPHSLALVRLHAMYTKVRMGGEPMLPHQAIASLRPEIRVIVGRQKRRQREREREGERERGREGERERGREGEREKGRIPFLWSHVCVGAAGQRANFQHPRALGHLLTRLVFQADLDFSLLWAGCLRASSPGTV